MGEKNPMYNKPITDKHRQKLIKSAKQRDHPNNGGLNKTHRKNISLSRKGIKCKLVKCPHCGKCGGNNMKRYHFDNCKYKDDMFWEMW